jgi:hypothetical protein
LGEYVHGLSSEALRISVWKGLFSAIFSLFILILFWTSFAETLHFEVILYYTLGLVSRNENKLCSIWGIADGTFGEYNCKVFR